MFDINLLTGHVRIRPRREMARLAAAISPKGGTPAAMKDIDVYMIHFDNGAYALAQGYSLPTQERYINLWLCQAHQSVFDIGSTFCLEDLWPEGKFPEGISYYLIANDCDEDVCLVSRGRKHLVLPYDTIIKAHSMREVSVYAGTRQDVLTLSEYLNS